MITTVHILLSKELLLDLNNWNWIYYKNYLNLNYVTDPNNNICDRKLTFKNNAPFISCITKIDNTIIDNAEDLKILIPMYNLIKYCKNYLKSTESLWNH